METEAKIQSDSVQWYRNNYCLKHHNPRCVIFQVPNEIAMEIRGILMRTRLPQKTINQIIGLISQRLINMGLLAGVSDTVLTTPDGRTLFVEFKTPTGYQSKEQKIFQESVTSTGHEYHVVRSLEQFKSIITGESK